MKLRRLGGVPNCELARHDIVLPDFVEVDEIYNLACPAAPKHYRRHAILARH